VSRTWICSCLLAVFGTAVALDLVAIVARFWLKENRSDSDGYTGAVVGAECRVGASLPSNLPHSIHPSARALISKSFRTVKNRSPGAAGFPCREG
jgi:hypothetical protein